MRARFIRTNGTFEIDEGCVFVMNKDETLDKATIRISNLASKLDISAYDEVYVSDPDGRIDGELMIVDTFQETMTCLGPKSYMYEISLFSKTKELEGILLPNLKITKMPGTFRSIWHYMEEYLEEYSPRIRVGTDRSDYTFVQKYTLDDTFGSDFVDECPEMQWNKPTLREVLNDLAMVKDRIVVLKGNKVAFMDLTETTTPSVTAKSAINYVQRSQSSEDYISALRMEMVNVTNDTTTGINNFVTRTEWFSITSEDALINEQNYHIETRYPIYKIKSLQIKFPASSTFWDPNGRNKSFSRWYGADLMDCTLGDSTDANKWPHMRLVYEDKEWQTKKIKYLEWHLVSHGDYDEYKNFTLHYARGSNVIDGFTQTTKVGFWTYYLPVFVKIAIMQGIMPYSIYEPVEFHPTLIQKWDTNGAQTMDVNPYYMAFFKVEYETLEGFVFEADKDPAPKHMRIVTDNQTNSYVDSYSQGALEYMKANRLGNMQRLINATYRAGESDMLKIGDVVDGAVIYRCEYQIYARHIEVNAMATDDYVLRDYYTGVKAKIRSWVVVSEAEALTRHDLTKIYAELSYVSRSETQMDSNMHLATYFLSPLLAHQAGKPIKYGFVETWDFQNVKYPSGEGQSYMMDLISRLVGDSITFTIGFKDNYWVDKYIDVPQSEITKGSGANNMKINDSYLVNGGIPTQYYRYTDPDGENVRGYIYLADTFRLAGVTNPTGTAEDARSVELAAASYALPKVTTPAWVSRVSWDLEKDSQEILYRTIQFEFCRDTTDIAFSKLFVATQEAIRSVGNNGVTQAYVAEPGTYNLRRPEVPDRLEAHDVTVAVSYVAAGSAKATVTFEDELDLVGKTIYLTDPSGNLIVALNDVPEANVEDNAVSFYLNMLRSRDPNVYSDETAQTVVDTI